MTDIATENAYTSKFDQADGVGSILLQHRQMVFPPFVLFKKARRFQSLDGWRAIAIVAVMWHHTLALSFASPIASEGRHGVTLFFVMSGFLIITLLLRSQESRSGFTLWKFWVRRALRILPIYYTVLGAYVILVHFTDKTASAATFFSNLPFFASFTTNWFVRPSDHTIFYFSWSLAAEEQFYMIWPLVEVLVSRPLLKFILLAVVAVTSRFAILYENVAGINSLPVHIVAAIPLGITLGTGLAHLLNHATGFRIAYRILGQRGSALGCLALAAIVAIVSPMMGEAGEILVSITLFLLVACTVIREDHDLARVLRWRPIVWIGTVSYGMYLMHMLAVNAVEKAAPIVHVGSPTVLFLTTVALATAMASLSFVFYERRFLIIKDRFFHV